MKSHTLKEQLTSATENFSKICKGVCDTFLCWPDTPAGQNATLNCPQLKGVLENAKAFKYCNVNGTWETRLKRNATQDYTHYEYCILPQLQDLTEMCSEFGSEICAKIGRITRCIETIGLSFSLVSLILSLYIFFSYRVLKNNRTKIHKHLFIATLLQVMFRLLKYIDQGMDENKKFLSANITLYVFCTAFMEYAKTAMFTWMFIEGMYLHNMITVTVFQEYNYIKIYIFIGWTAPAVMTIIWLVVMFLKAGQTTWEYYFFLNSYWILEGPRSILIVVNFLFLLNIIRVLIVKLRETRTREIIQVQKAVRAAIFLLPLMGTAHIFFLLDYRFNEAWKFALWSYTTYFLITFQGFFVAVLYCFLNGEVHTAIRNSFYLHLSLRNYDYTPCRNLTLISTVGNDTEANNSTSEASRWIKCCQQQLNSPEEKEINLCDLGDRGNTSTTTGIQQNSVENERNPEKKWYDTSEASTSLNETRT